MSEKKVPQKFGDVESSYDLICEEIMHQLARKSDSTYPYWDKHPLCIFLPYGISISGCPIWITSNLPIWDKPSSGAGFLPQLMCSAHGCLEVSTGNAPGGVANLPWRGVGKNQRVG
jgi:hypothetical protein